MRVEYTDLMEKLGTGHVLSPYETRPWFHYESDSGITCSAEVRIGPGTADVEAEIQFLYDETDARYDDDADFGMPEQVLFMRFLPSRDDIWSPKFLYVKGESYTNTIHNWGERGSELFLMFISALQMGELPDIDELIEEHLTDKSRGGRGGKRGRVGKKGFKVEQKPAGMSMNMKN